MSIECQDKNQPLVSIVIPVYNGSNYVTEAIESALNQTYENVEVLVINDGSTDGGKTEEVVLEYGDRIRYFKKENGGVATALNYGIEKMKGEYFSWLSHDDLYTPDKIKKEMEVIFEKGDCIVCCDVTVIDQNRNIIQVNHMAERKSKSISCFLAFDTDTGLNGCSLLVPKKCFDRCGKFLPELKCTQDYDMWYRFAQKYNFEFCSDNLVLSRRHDEQDSRTKGNLCTEEADLLHSKIVKTISADEMYTYEADLSYFENLYRIYYISHYYKTAAQILIKLLELYRQKGFYYTFGNLFQTEIVQLDETIKVDKIIFDIDRFKDIGKSKKNIMFYCNVWTKGGIEKVVSILLPELVKKYNIILVSNDEPDVEEGFQIPQDVFTIKIGEKLGDRLPFSLLVLAEILHIDLFVGNPNIIEKFLDTYSLMEDSGIRTILCNHGNYFLPCWAEYLWPLFKKRREVYPKATLITWPNSFNAFLGSKICSNTILLPNPNFFEKQKDLKIQKEEKIILYVGRFYDQIKRIDRAIKVFRKVIDSYPDSKLWLVGGYDLDMPLSGENKKLRELIQELDFPNESSITWFGEQEQVERFYRRASIAMVTSASEGFGMVVNEAAIFGCPTVLFDIPGMEDLIQNGENGIIVKQDDIDGMAEAICRLLSEPARLEKMRNSAIMMAERFDKRNIILKWENIIESVLKDHVETVIAQYRVMDEKEYTLKAIEIYKEEISKANSYKFPYMTDAQIKDLEDTNEQKIAEYLSNGEDKLKAYENILIESMDEKENFLQENVFKIILERLPLNDERKRIGIYGTGVHTKSLLNKYRELIGEIKADVIFIDTKKKSLVEEYEERAIYNINDIGMIGLDGIIISSRLYEDEMCQKVEELYGTKYPLYRFYEKSKEKLF